MSIFGSFNWLYGVGDVDAVYPEFECSCRNASYSWADSKDLRRGPIHLTFPHES
jgi:hypothetical protein